MKLQTLILRKHWPFTLAAVTGSLILGAWLFRLGRITASKSLPAVSEITSIKAHISGFDDPFDVEVPQNRWKQVLDTLYSARVDSNPARWEVLGSLEITTQDEHQVVLMLYWVNGGNDGAFSNNTGPGPNTYFRGNDSKRLLKLLREIHAESKPINATGN